MLQNIPYFLVQQFRHLNIILYSKLTYSIVYGCDMEVKMLQNISWFNSGRHLLHPSKTIKTI